MIHKHTCNNCNVDFETRKSTSKYCSKKCIWIHKGWSNEPNTNCTHCKKDFHLKQSAKLRYKRRLGYFCSNSCFALYKSESGAYDGDKNPNYRGRKFDGDGYALRDYAPHAGRVNGLKRMKLHQAVCCELLGTTKIEKGLHVHHRDCNVLNNEPENLAVLSISDHKWMHKQYGSAILYAYYNKLVSFENLVEWSNDKERSVKLLNLNVTEQTIESIFNDTEIRLN